MKQATGSRKRAQSTAAKKKARAEKDRAPRRRDSDVLDAAARLFARQHYAGTTIQDVADELGILKGSVYHYIDTKEDLLFWLLEEVHEAVGKILSEVAEQTDLPALERLALYVREQVHYNLDNLERISIYYHDIESLTDKRVKVLSDRRHEHERFVTSLIQEAQESGAADPTLDPRLLCNCIFGTIIWTYRWYKPGTGPSREKIAAMCADFALRGVAGQPYEGGPSVNGAG